MRSEDEIFRPIGKQYSWEIFDEDVAVKVCDKSFFEYDGSGVPRDFGWYFSAEKLDKKTLVFL